MKILSKRVKTLDDMFNAPSKEVIRTEEKILSITIPLYRGFSGDLKNLQTEGDYYIFSPEKSEQGMLWFTHPYISHYDPIDYAKNHGDWFMTYYVDAKKHTETQHHEDGTSYNATPQYFNKLTEPTSNSKFWLGIELPDGYVFSYKTEKFIGCKIKIKVKKTAVIPSH